MTADMRAGQDVVPGVAQSGGAYRAELKRGDTVVWSCAHLHFTDHSARSCAERHAAHDRRAAELAGAAEDERLNGERVGG